MKVLAAAGAAVIALGLTACGTSGNPDTPSETGGKPELKIGMAYDIGGRGDKSFNDSAAAGLDKLKTDLAADFEVTTNELPAVLNETEDDKYARLLALCQGGYDPVIAVGFVYAGADPTKGPLARAANECPDTKFAIIDDSSVTLPNVAGLTFAEHEGSFLVGAAAALKSETGRVGFVGGCLVDLIKKFEAGYTAGAKYINPDIVVDPQYLSTVGEFCSGFNDPAKGKTTAEGMYDAGADIVYQAAGGSGTGVFQAASEKGKLAIGVDSDQYNTVDPSLKDVIITSMLKRVDIAVYDFVTEFSEGNFTAGKQVFDLKADGVGFSTTGGAIDDIEAQLDDLKDKIISGEIEVPEAPAA
jgi:basic membrane protein A and related proteins